ncbi:hypothetical protein LZ31DRAFT_112484 [Colletotrichum somersetense]|nr:hypothetical protein LZ31DRAFT_112484 [Colletotrichum somersetense]
MVMRINGCVGAMPLTQVNHVYHRAIKIQGVRPRVASKGMRLASLSYWPRRSRQPYCYVCDVWIHFWRGRKLNTLKNDNSSIVLSGTPLRTLCHTIQWKWRRLALGGEIALIIVAAHVSAMCNMDGLERPECAAAPFTPLSHLRSQARGHNYPSGRQSTSRKLKKPDGIFCNSHLLTHLT